MKYAKYIFIISILFYPMFSVSAEDASYKIKSSAKLVMEDTYGKTYWDNVKDNGAKLYLKPVYDNDFRDVLRFITLPDLSKTEVEVPLEDFFKNHNNLLVDGKLYSILQNGNERKNYWIEDCFFYDTQNHEAGLQILNYFLKTDGSTKRALYVHWDLKENKITKAVQLMEFERKKYKGDYEYTAETIEPVGYNRKQKTMYYLKIADYIKVVKDGKYNKYLRTKNLACTFYSLTAGIQQEIISMDIGSIDTMGAYSAELNTYFFPGYRDLADNIDKKSPEGFIVDLSEGTYKKIPIQPHAYWADFSEKNNILLHISSSTGKLIATDIQTGRQKGSVQLGDAGDDRYRKFAVKDDETALYYIQGKLISIDINTLNIKKTDNLAVQFKEFSASSPAYILPYDKGIIVEARTVHNKTTGFLYLLQ